MSFSWNKRIGRQHGCSCVFGWARAEQVKIKFSQLDKLWIGIHIALSLRRAVPCPKPQVLLACNLPFAAIKVNLAWKLINNVVTQAHYQPRTTAHTESTARTIRVF